LHLYASLLVGFALLIKAVVFDLFGTLTACFPLDAADALLEVMAKDLAVDAGAFRSAWTATHPERMRHAYLDLAENVRAILKELGSKSTGSKAERVAKLRVAFERRALTPRADALSTIQAIRAKGIRLGLISNCSQAAPEAWGSSQLAGQFDVEVFSCDHPWEKPDPRIYHYACDALRVRPEDCLFVGDGSSGELEGAEAAGLTAVLIRAADDDGSYPGRTDADHWTGPRIAAVSEILDVVDTAYRMR
jgi:putative hydrolase of the HAD superfamily